MSNRLLLAVTTRPFATITILLSGSLFADSLFAEEKLVPGKDRIDTPAVVEGLCIHNLFQSNMVVQRDKPIPLWGWADPGEEIWVSFAGQMRSSTAAADRSWRVELPAMPASSESRAITVRGKRETIELTNILVGDVWLLGG